MHVGERSPTSGHTQVVATQVDIRKVKTRNQAEIEGREDSFQVSLAAALCALSGGVEGVAHLITLVLCLWK